MKSLLFLFLVFSHPLFAANSHRRAKPRPKPKPEREMQLLSYQELMYLRTYQRARYIRNVARALAEFERETNKVVSRTRVADQDSNGPSLYSQMLQFVMPEAGAATCLDPNYPIDVGTGCARYFTKSRECDPKEQGQAVGHRYLCFKKNSLPYSQSRSGFDLTPPSGNDDRQLSPDQLNQAAVRKINLHKREVRRQADTLAREAQEDFKKTRQQATTAIQSAQTANRNLAAAHAASDAESGVQGFDSVPDQTKRASEQLDAAQKSYNEAKAKLTMAESSAQASGLNTGKISSLAGAQQADSIAQGQLGQASDAVTGAREASETATVQAQSIRKDLEQRAKDNATEAAAQANEARSEAQAAKRERERAESLEQEAKADQDPYGAENKVREAREAAATAKARAEDAARASQQANEQAQLAAKNAETAGTPEAQSAATAARKSADSADKALKEAKADQLLAEQKQEGMTQSSAKTKESREKMLRDDAEAAKEWKRCRSVNLGEARKKYEGELKDKEKNCNIGLMPSRYKENVVKEGGCEPVRKRASDSQDICPKKNETMCNPLMVCKKGSSEDNVFPFCMPINQHVGEDCFQRAETDPAHYSHKCQKGSIQDWKDLDGRVRGMCEGAAKDLFCFACAKAKQKILTELDRAQQEAAQGGAPVAPATPSAPTGPVGPPAVTR